MAQVKTADEEAGTAKQEELPLHPAYASAIAYKMAGQAAALRQELDLIPSEEFAKALGLEDQTLAGWRSEGQGPSFVKLGKTVFYRRDLIKDWIGRSVTVLPKAA